MSHLIEWIVAQIAASQDFFQSLGLLGILVYAGVILVVQMGLLPVSPLGMGAGIIFGLAGGYTALELGSAGGVMLNFLLARYIARGWVAKRLGQHEKFKLIDSAIGQEGAKIVFLLRFCPIPFGLANFLFGLTALRFWPYTIASLAAIAVPNFFFVYLGATAGASLQSLAGGGRPRHPFEYVLLGLGFVAGFVALTYIGRLARAAVARAEAGNQAAV